MTRRLLVVGAGICGLAAAVELSRQLPTSLIDRLPVIGGITAGYENPLAVNLASECRTNGVDFVLGTTGLRWANNSLLVAGPEVGLRRLEGSHLVYAGGTRPSTPGELRLAGSRLGGVYPATVAFHLIEIGVKLGHRPVVVGHGRWARRICRALAARDCGMTIVSAEAEREAEFAMASWLGWSPVALHGQGRVSALLVERAGVQQAIACDAVILAGTLRPMRNIDGAVFDEAEQGNVSFVQLASETADEAELANHGRQAATRILTQLKGTMT